MKPTLAQLYEAMENLDKTRDHLAAHADELFTDVIERWLNTLAEKHPTWKLEAGSGMGSTGITVTMPDSQPYQIIHCVPTHGYFAPIAQQFENLCDRHVEVCDPHNKHAWVDFTRDICVIGKDFQP